MEYGTIFGHGAYLGPDFTADYIERAREAMLRDYDARGVSAAAARVVEDFKTNRWDATSDLLSTHRPRSSPFGSSRTTTAAGVADFLESDHATIDDLLSASVVGDVFDLSVYGAFRGRLLRHIGMRRRFWFRLRAAAQPEAPLAVAKQRRPLKVSADPGAPSAATPVPAVAAAGRPAGATRNG